MVETNADLGNFIGDMNVLKGHAFRNLEGTINYWNGEHSGHYNEGLSLLRTPDDVIHGNSLRVFKNPEEIPTEPVNRAPNHEISILYSAHVNNGGREIIGGLQQGNLSGRTNYILRVEEVSEEEGGVMVSGVAIPYEIHFKPLRRINLDTESGSRRWNATIDKFVNNATFMDYIGEPVQVCVMFKVR